MVDDNVVSKMNNRCPFIFCLSHELVLLYATVSTATEERRFNASLFPLPVAHENSI